MKRRFFYFIFSENLVYDLKEGYRTAVTTCLYKTFKSFTDGDSGDVDNIVKSANQAREFILHWSDFFETVK